MVGTDLTTSTRARPSPTSVRSARTPAGSSSACSHPCSPSASPPNARPSAASSALPGRRPQPPPCLHRRRRSTRSDHLSHARPQPRTGIHVAYFIGHRETTARTECPGRPVLGGIRSLEKALEETPSTRSISPCPAARPRRSPRSSNASNDLPSTCVSSGHQPRHMPQNMAVSELDGMPILSVRESPLRRRRSEQTSARHRRLHRGPHPARAVCGHRPARPHLRPRTRHLPSTRVSLGGETFNIYSSAPCSTSKTRNPPAGPPATTPRHAYRQGLRKTSSTSRASTFSEARCPRRPAWRPELIEQFREDWAWLHVRQHVKAGMTGWVNGLRGDTSLKKRIQYDLFYVRHWSIGFDIRILFLTLSRGLHRNALI